MPPILTALSSGISAKKILEYLMRKSPELAPRITKALASGLSAEKIIGFFSKEKNFDKLRQSIQQEYSLENNANPMVQGENIRSKNLAPDMASNLQRNVPGMVGTGLSALGTGMALNHALPNLLKTPMQGKTEKTPETPLQPPVNPANIPQQAQQNQAPSAMPSAPISPSSPPVQPEVNNTPIKAPDVRSILDKYGLSQHVDKLSERNKDPKQIAAVLYSRFPKEMKQFQDEAGKHMEDAIGDYLASSQNALKPTELVENPQISPKNAQNPSLNEKKSLKVDESSYNAPEEKPIAKSDIVASPQGVGEVKEVRGGEAVIDVDGKLHKVKEDELIPSPIPEKDLATLYDDMIQGIEKETGQQVSRNVEWAGYDPKSNELAYKPHQSGRLYVYDDISPEDVELLTNFLTKRKSTGENFIGAWQAGTESPIGAAMYQLIKKLQAERGGKGNEYKNRYETIYDALEPAKEAKKRKYAEERKKKAKKPRLD